MLANKKIKWILIGLAVLIGVRVAWLIIVPRIALIGTSTKHHVYVAVGFKFTLSRNGDHRYTRRLLNRLDRLNERSVPIRVHWSIDNRLDPVLYETGQLDPGVTKLINAIRRRIKDYGDKIIPAGRILDPVATAEELETALEPLFGENADLHRLFGQVEQIYFPAFGAAGPGRSQIYRQAGIQVVLQSYSAADFATLSPFNEPLNRTYAHNLLRYLDKPEDSLGGSPAQAKAKGFSILPIYGPGDIVDNVSLERWVEELHREQLRGEIKHDVIIALQFSQPVKNEPSEIAGQPSPKKIQRLLAAVHKIDNVRWTTIPEYIKNRQALRDFSIPADVLGGHSQGLTAWALRPAAQAMWSAITGNRRAVGLGRELYSSLNQNLPAAYKQATLRSLKLRTLLLSSDHFRPDGAYLYQNQAEKIRGQLEAATVELFEGYRQSVLYSTAQPPPVADNMVPLGAYRLLTPGSAGGGGALGLIHFAHMAIWPEDIPGFTGADCKSNFIANGPTGRLDMQILNCRQRGQGMDLHLFFPKALESPAIITLAAGPPQPGRKRSPVQGATQLGPFILNIGVQGRLETVTLGGVAFLKAGSLQPAIQWEEGWAGPEQFSWQTDPAGQLIMQADWVGLTDPQSPEAHNDAGLGPQLVTPGKVDYRFSTLGELPFFVLTARLIYPRTESAHWTAGGTAGFYRQVDLRWRQVRPAPLHLAAATGKEQPFKVHKQGFTGQETDYLIDQYRQSGANVEVESMNYHLTPDYMAVLAAKQGLLVSQDVTICPSFAFAPLSQSYSFWTGNLEISVNPFGVSYGQTIRPFSRNSGFGHSLMLLPGRSEHQSPAPLYNGTEQHFTVLIGSVTGAVTKRDKQLAQSFAQPAQAFRLDGQASRRPPPSLAKTLLPPAGVTAVYNKEGRVIYTSWEVSPGAKGYAVFIRSKGQSQPIYETAIQGTQLSIPLSVLMAATGEGFDPKQYRVEVIAKRAEGRSEPAQAPLKNSQELAEHPSGPVIPLGLRLRMILAKLESGID